jgi:hypothetical protein
MSTRAHVTNSANFKTFIDSFICVGNIKSICANTKLFFFTAVCVHTSSFIFYHFAPRTRSMKLLLTFVILSLLLSTVTSKRHKSARLRCGLVIDACLGQMGNGKCPKVPFCPGHAPRVLTKDGCCCSVGNVTQVTGDLAPVLTENDFIFEQFF